jgi:hypothetical protein
MTLAIAVWGALVSTTVLGLDLIRMVSDSVPEFYVRTQVEAAGETTRSGQKPGRFRVTVANISKPTASLDPILYLLSIDARSGNMRQAQLQFSEAEPNSGGEQYIPGRPPTLKTGEEASAVIATTDLGSATSPLDYLAVKFTLVSGRQYLATISEPKYLTRKKAGAELIGWSGGAVANTNKWRFW